MINRIHHHQKRKYKEKQIISWLVWYFVCRKEDIRLEIERLKKELKQSKKTSVPIKSSEVVIEEETERNSFDIYLHNFILF